MSSCNAGEALSGKQATLDGDGRTFEEIVRERHTVISGDEFRKCSENLKARLESVGKSVYERHELVVRHATESQVNGHGSKFGRKKEQTIVAPLTERKVEEAARSAGISPATLMRWQKEPEFQAAYRKARSDAFGQCVALLQKASSAATTTLLNLMVDKSTPAGCELPRPCYRWQPRRPEMEHVGARLSSLEE